MAGRTNLALIYQEILTAITRFRSNRQAVADAGSFRNQIKAAIGAAESEATRKGYAADDVRLATFAVVAFLDESILNSNNPIFTDWPRMPLQEELFGVHTAGEMFFHCIDRLMAKSDSPQAADVLEIYALCLLLGYRGRYSISGQEGVRVRRFHGDGKAPTSSWRTAPAGSELGAAKRCGPAESLRSLGSRLSSSAHWERCFLRFCFSWGSSSRSFPGHRRLH